MGRCGTVQNILLGSQVTNGAPPANAPLVCLLTNGAPAGGAPLVVLQKSKKNILMAHSLSGAPLLVRTSNGAPRLDAPLGCTEKSEFFLLLVAHHFSGAPLVSSTLMVHLHMVRH